MSVCSIHWRRRMLSPPLKQLKMKWNPNPVPQPHYQRCHHRLLYCCYDSHHLLSSMASMAEFLSSAVELRPKRRKNKEEEEDEEETLGHRRRSTADASTGIFWPPSSRCWPIGVHSRVASCSHFERRLHLLGVDVCVSHLQ